MSSKAPVTALSVSFTPSGDKIEPFSHVIDGGEDEERWEHGSKRSLCKLLPKFGADAPQTFPDTVSMVQWTLASSVSRRGGQEFHYSLASCGPRLVY